MTKDSPKRRKRATRSEDSTEQKRARRSKDSKAEQEAPHPPDQKEPPEPKASLTDPHRLAEIFVWQHGLERPNESLLFWRDQCWVWNGRRYAVLPPADLRARLTRIIRQTFDRDQARIAAKAKEEDAKFQAQVTRGLVSNVLQALQSLRHLASSVEQPVWMARNRPPLGFIAVENGLLDVDALLHEKRDALRPHPPQWSSPVCLGYPYDPDATCPAWLAFLNEALEGDAERVALVQEWFGYCLRHDTSLQKFLILVGEGADGKTVLVSVLIALLGPENVSHVPLELFGKRFQLTPTLGKLLNAVTEIGEVDKFAEGLLKAFVSGDPMFFDRKNLPGLNVRPTARSLFTTNNLPKFRDRSSGLWRRMIVLPFRRSVPVDRQDPRLVDKLTAELPGIFNWAVEGLRRLRCQGRFTEPTLCRKALDTYRTESNPARVFLLEYVIADPSTFVECAVLYGRYQGWSEQYGYWALNNAQFGHEVHRIFPSIDRKKVASLDEAARRVWAYTGIKLT